MNRNFIKLFALIFLIILASESFSQISDPNNAIISVERIWDRAGHNAFTDLIFFNGKFFCSFREGSHHVYGLNGTIRIISSKDGMNWQSVALLQEAGIDLRDPKLSVTPDGRIMVNIGGSYYQDTALMKMEPKVTFSDQTGDHFSVPQNVFIDSQVRTDKDWLWRVTWHKQIGYGVIYQSINDESKTHLLKTDDGITYSLVTTFALTGRPNETTLRMLADGRMLALVRREGENRSGKVGVSQPPFQQWFWSELSIPLGGPNFIQLPNGELICATREYLPEKKTATSLFKLTENGEVKPVLTLPSGGDTSYPGLLIHNDMLFVSYYSSHEDKTAIYLAKIRIENL
jgi:hypothetical protein